MQEAQSRLAVNQSSPDFVSSNLTQGTNHPWLTPLERTALSGTASKKWITRRLNSWYNGYMPAAGLVDRSGFISRGGRVRISGLVPNHSGLTVLAEQSCLISRFRSVRFRHPQPNPCAAALYRPSQRSQCRCRILGVYARLKPARYWFDPSWRHQTCPYRLVVGFVLGKNEGLDRNQVGAPNSKVRIAT